MIKTKRNNAWTSVEIELISQLYSQFTSKRWKRIAQEFKARGFDRTQIECREKWINFVDPHINRTDWSEQELKKLYDLYEQVGTRWCLVQKSISRTQNQIKNRFYGTLRNFIRFTLAYFDTQQSCFNTQISHLSPNFLNSLFSSSGDFLFMENQVKQSIYSMRYKVDKQLLLMRISSKRNLYQRLNQIVLQHFALAQSTKNQSNIDLTNNNTPNSNDSMQIFPFQQTPLTQWGIYPFMNYQNGQLYWAQ